MTIFLVDLDRVSETLLWNPMKVELLVRLWRLSTICGPKAEILRS
jgi:hypothetical protein